MNKGINLVSELQEFFKNQDSSKAVASITRIMNNLTIRRSVIGVDKHKNCKLTFVQVLQLLIVYPFFSVKNPLDYENSAIGKFFSCKKDMFYRFMNNENVKWRSILYCINRQLIALCSRSEDANKKTKVLILDDTDMPKSGYKAEGLGRVFSHVTMKSILGFKALFLCYSDGKSQFMIDSTIQAEKGKNPENPQGMIKKYRDRQYTKERDSESETECRKQEMFESKIKNSIQMIKRAIKAGIRFDYLLVDSWFPCAELFHFIKSRHFKCNLVGMIKMGKTKYSTSLGELKAPDIIKKLEANQKKHSKSAKLTKVQKTIKYSRAIGYYYATVDAIYSGISVRIHFFKKNSEDWNAIISTDTTLNAIEVFRLYARRWVIEVANKEMKGYLNLGKSQFIDFAGQVASLSLCMIQYNILCYAKRINSYETTGGLFRDIKDEALELTLAEKIWGIIVETANAIAEFVECDPFVLIEKICNGNANIARLARLLSNLPNDLEIA